MKYFSVWDTTTPDLSLLRELLTPERLIPPSLKKTMNSSAIAELGDLLEKRFFGDPPNQTDDNILKVCSFLNLLTNINLLI